MKAGRYYVSALVDIPAPEADGNFTDGIGIDLGLERLCSCVKWNCIQKYQ